MLQNQLIFDKIELLISFEDHLDLFFFGAKKYIFFNLIHNKSGTGKLNFEFYSNNVKRCNMQYCILFIF